MSATPVAEATRAIEDLEEEIRREQDRKYAFYRMLHATDLVLWKLEELNRDGVERLPADMRARMRESLGELPAACLEVYSDSDSVQEVLEGVFSVQDRLFAWHNPDYESEEEVL